MTRKKFDLSTLPKLPDLKIEKRLWKKGSLQIGGIDEAGRGALAGPVTAAVVILPNTQKLTQILAGVRDSKQMTALQRERFEPLIKEVALSWGVGFASPAEIDIPQEKFVKGDMRSLTIAAASVLAKTARDAQMCLLDEQFSGYELSRHKGYGTRLHREAIHKLGKSRIHRQSFNLKK
jgi:ribonuclease HII